ncbi:MAG: hypothetical protein HGA86_08720 [Anaerolineaceae bacterium]|nr:hypothetical protein [Anaerolineaceae bacterium]
MDFSSVIHSSALKGLAVLAVFALLAGLYFLSWWAAGFTNNRDAWLLTVGFGLAFGILLLFMYPYGAADIFDYIMHARIISVYHANPFFETIGLYPSDPFYDYAYWKSTPAQYGPLWELISAVPAKLAGDSIINTVLAFKGTVGIFYLASVGMVALILRRQAPQRALAGTLLFAWNPMVIYETFGNGHNDIVMVFFILLAAWAMSRRFYALAIVALTAGTMAKYMPILLIPAAGLIALREIKTNWHRLRYILVAGISSALFVAICFAPFWEGLSTLTVLKRAILYTSSFPSVVLFSFSDSYGYNQTASFLGPIWTASTALFALWMGYRAYRDQDWTSFARSGALTLLFYNLVCNTWFHVWYAMWSLGLIVLLPVGPVWGLGILFSFSVLIKPFFIRPSILWPNPKMSRLLREASLWLGMQLLPWLYTLGYFLFGRKKKPVENKRSES